MLRSLVQVLLLALCSSVLLLQVIGAPYRGMPTEIVRADITDDKELAQFLKFMFKLTRGDEMLHQLEDKEGGRDRVMRRHIPLSQRERKAGCRNFFWKTFTSC
ncbi:somatostatin [Parambassis ranga]|uniref:Somatostatin n=1 Tax=Parambassis ranga TaxID=210632 RepID=A0A6P7K6G3_9TELE|nr:somatostatin-like [Parambassis ranga]